MKYIKLVTESKKHPGKTILRCVPVFDDEYETLVRDEMNGFCLKCGNQQYGVEPDARRYKCEDCGEFRVYGLEELLLMGVVLTREPKPQETVYEAQ